MKARLERTQLLDLISQADQLSLAENEKEIFHACARSSTWLWAGFVEDQCVCVVGLIPPTLLSDQAYLWLHTTPALTSHEFLFVRYSQRFVEKALDLFPSIVGITAPSNKKAIRWLEWLGAKFAPQSGPMLSFEIRKT